MISALGIALPILVIIVAGKLMVEVSGRDRVVESISGKPEDFPKALQSRFYGYNAAEAKTYWDALRDEGRKAEIRLLQFDLLFPLLYGAALAFSVMTLWSALDIRTSMAWFLVPVIAAVITDWIETAILLQQVKNFDSTGTFDAGQIQVASIATIAKSISIALSALLIISFAVMLLSRDRGPEKTGVRTSSPALH